MNRSGWDARRRNRNIGTRKSGHGQNNHLTIPQSWADDRLFHERLKNPVALELKINKCNITLLIEETHPDFCHACTPNDIECVLNLIPEEHLEPIKMVVLRQPKKKEQILGSVWGRLRYWSEIEQYSGPAVHLEAQLKNRLFRWRKTLAPDDLRELERLAKDGHQIESDRRYYYIKGGLEAIRNTQLFRTLPHEIGHYVDYLENVEIPSGDNDETWKQLDSLYDAKPSKDKEDFAHRYAREFFELQCQHGKLPFQRIFNPKSLREKNLDPMWFSNENLSSQ
ncbi:MAG: hypothetical protein AAGG51_07685 [Cyanobacteria bacterium P01_G01_bin.54]